MGDVYLPLDAWLTDAGVRYRLYDSSWAHRARSTGGFEPGRPWVVMWHHTASVASPQSDADYMCAGSPDRPIANLMIDRTGLVWVLAGGATNTNGKGRSRTFSKGTVPADSMNTYAVGMELCNDGIGEFYPVDQIEAAFAVSLCVQRRLALMPADCESHQDYAPDRKIDPARAASVTGEWEPASVTSAGSWSVGDLRAEHERRSANGGGGDVTVDEVRQALRDVLNEGAPFGTGGDPAFPGRPWAEGNAKLTPTVQSTFNNTQVIVAMLNAAKAALPGAVVGLAVGVLLGRNHVAR